MHDAPPHLDEEHRLAVLRGLGILDTPPEARFDRITRVAAALFDVPVALVGLIDSDRQWYKSCIGIDAAETDRSVTFCAHAITRDEPLIIEDTHRDVFFHDHPMVTDGLRVRFYAGVALRPFEDMPIGTLCIVDTEPRTFSSRDRELLADLAQWAE
ncbi:MAG TPA: GAF domain-containing protein, partial [Acidimicrobiales bacterium]|nr:GAF domain-containing protein [Acidimicrobiales bacterium]